jgi:hypothetical protein
MIEIILSFLINTTALAILIIIFVAIIGWKPRYESYIHRHD